MVFALDWVECSEIASEFKENIDQDLIGKFSIENKEILPRPPLSIRGQFGRGNVSTTVVPTAKFPDMNLNTFPIQKITTNTLETKIRYKILV